MYYASLIVDADKLYFTSFSFLDQIKV